MAKVCDIIFVHRAHVITWRGGVLRVKTANNWILELERTSP